jgi:excisionase family DNA binding protein
MEGYITTTQAAERLGVSSARVRQLVAAGTLPAHKFGPVNMVRETD